MTVAAHQPNCLPNLGFFYKMLQVDLFIIIGNIQFEKHEGWQRRHKIKTANGDIWLTVPVIGTQNQMIRDVRINNQSNWRRKHQQTLKFTYGKTPEQDILKRFCMLYEREWDRLIDFNTAVIMFLKKELEILTEVVVDEDVGGKKHELLINICKKYNADTYLSGMGAKNYMDKKYYDELAAHNIAHQFIEKNVTGMYPYSTIHYILSEGLTKTKSLLHQQ